MDLYKENCLPLVSVIVPVKKEAKIFESTLKTILSQDYEPLQVVVSDGSGSNDIFTLVNSLNDARIKYVKPPAAQTFSDDWNYALDEADGEYVTFLGDDDGMLPGALSFAIEALLKNNFLILTWKKINYSWPDHLIESSKNVIEGKSSPYLNVYKAKKALSLLVKFKIGYNQLPCIYNSLVKKDLILLVKQRSLNNKFFGGIIPDVYSATALAAVVENYLYASFPLTVNGASHKSSGVIQGLKNRSCTQESLISDVLDSGKTYHKDIGNFSGSIASIVLGEYLLAKSNITGVNLPKPNWRAYVHYLIYEAQGSVRKLEILKAARYTAVSRNMMVFVPNINRYESATPLTSFDGRLVLPVDLIKDVADSTLLCESLIPSSVEIEYHPIRRVLKSWLTLTVRSVIEIYRNWRLS